MNIKITKAVFESAQMARARNDVRYYINCIAILPDMQVAGTNGHVLFIGGKAETSKPVKGTVLLDVQKSPTQRYHHVVINTITGIATFRTDQNVDVGVSLVKLVDGKYPDVLRIVNSFENNPAERIGFNAAYLSMVGKIGKLFNNQFSSVVIKLSGESGHSLSEFNDNYKNNGKLVVMPMRID